MTILHTAQHTHTHWADILWHRLLLTSSYKVCTYIATMHGAKLVGHLSARSSQNVNSIKCQFFLFS